MNPLHPYLAELLAREHARYLYAAARKPRRAARRPPQPRRLPIRQRAGWRLVEIGLTLVSPKLGSN